jgi:hypothetical protein
MMENNGECSQKRIMQQTTLSFPVLSYTHFDSSNKKGKNKLVDHMDYEEVVNHENETPPKPIKQLKQTTLNFSLITNNTHKKRFFSDIDTDNNDTDIDDESDEHDDECSDDEYNAVPHDGGPHMCPKERKLRRHKYFSRLINPKHIRCICGKDLKLDKRYSVKNLRM